jgi:hypothetical protein
LQQYERLLKAVLSQHQLIASATADLETVREERIAAIARSTLGQLAGMMFEDLVLQEGEEKDLLSQRDQHSEVVRVGMWCGLHMAPQRWEEARDAVKQLVDLRNELVHHFIERFDVWTPQGCHAGLAHLTQAYESIDRHFMQLKEWSEGLEAASQHVASFFSSPSGYELIVNGIAPDGSIPSWGAAGIVRALRLAWDATAVEGWSSIDMAEVWISK